MRRHHWFRISSTLLAAIAWSGCTYAEELTLNSDQTLVLTLGKKPGTIIVSNPNIADVTLKSNTLLLLGKNFGATDVILLDENGRHTQSWQVHVVRGDPFGVTVFKNGRQESFTCKADCEATGAPNQRAVN